MRVREIEQIETKGKQSASMVLCKKDMKVMKKTREIINKLFTKEYAGAILTVY